MNSHKHFFKEISKLTKFHYNNSKEYKKIINLLYPEKIIKTVDSIPFIPAKLFKDMDLKSIPDNKVFKILESSGTSGGKPSKIYLDKENAKRQTLVLNEIVSNILGKKRIPMLIIDEKKNIFNPKKFDAKTAAILGFSLFGNSHHYLIEDKKINYKNLNNFLDKYSTSNFLIFGFTSYIYQFLLKDFEKNKIKKNFSKGILIHGGGWKKMEAIKISNKIFKKKLNEKLKLQNIFNYYGLIEQTGSIFFECQNCNCFTTSKYSDVLIRDKNFKILPSNKKGFIQLLSLLPKSYPGHSIITEDIGEIIDNNCNSCFGKKKFLVHGRAEKSEVRGCSDV
tara:strand:- start:1474 stop:2481 length:1008 start_codon:yes stop_codon:yes gene_type:complete